MKAIPNLLKLTAMLLIAGLLIYGYMKVANLKLVSTERTELAMPLDSELLVMPTKGLLLEVSTIRATETVEDNYLVHVMGVNVGKNVLSIRVPAVYRYHIDLAPEWKISRNGDLFTLVVPAVSPSLPVAVDLSRIEKRESGGWSTVITGPEQMDEVERTITKRLTSRAVNPTYIQMQREIARAKVVEFVRRWLIEQPQWKSATDPQIRVLFADESIAALGPTVFPLNEPTSRKPIPVGKP